MKHSTVISGVAFSAGLILLAASQPLTADDDHRDRIRVKLNGLNENLMALSTPATGRFNAKINRQGDASIDYELSYEGFPTPVQQAHIHFGQKYQNGGISVFLCSNLGNGPAGTQACPTPAGTITGTIVAANVIGPAGQGIAAGEFAELLDAMDRGATYVNIHSMQYPGGEIRAQIKVR